MVFTQIRNPNRLYETVAHCEGAVLYKDTKGVYRDLKPLAEQLFSMRGAINTTSASPLEIIAENKRDRDRLFRLMFEANAS